MWSLNFKSFSSVPESLQSSMQQQDAAGNLICMLGLSLDEEGELLQPEQIVNRVPQRFYYFLHLRSLNPEAEVPPLDEALHSLVEPDPLFPAKSEYGIRHFCKELPLTPNGKRNDSTGLGPVSFSSLASRIVEEVGSANPVADF